MRLEWIDKSGNEDLLVVMLGWACDEHTVEHLRFEGYDVVCAFDYRTLDAALLLSVLREYERVTLLSWSFGVWVSEYLWGQLSGLGNIVKCIAVNGTPVPIHARLGIPPKAFEVTLRSIKAMGLEKFYERMYDGPISNFNLSQRELTEQTDELVALADHFLQLLISEPVPWTSVVIGERDLIFPVCNMKNYWDKKSIFVPVVAPLPHYPFDEQGAQLITTLLHDAVQQETYP